VEERNYKRKRGKSSKQRGGKKNERQRKKKSAQTNDSQIAVTLKGGFSIF
jgi:hypothetical protein